MAYLVPDLDTRGRPYRWSINVANADGSGSRSVVTASLTGGCRGQQSVHAVRIPCSTPLSPDGSAIVFANQGRCEGDCPEFGFDDFGVWRWEVTSGQRTQIAEQGVYL